MLKRKIWPMNEGIYTNGKITNQNNLKRSVFISFLPWRWLLLHLLLMPMIFPTTVIIPIISMVGFTSISLICMLMFFSLLVPLRNSGTSFFTAIPDWTTVLPCSRTSAPTSSSSMARAYTPVLPSMAFMIVSVIMPSMALMRSLLMATMPVRTSASTFAVPSAVPPKQLAP